jgi:hypothetical protein
MTSELAAAVAAVRPRVTCYCDVDLVHAAYPVTGLIEMADAGEIELEFRYRDARVDEPRRHWTLWFRVQTPQADVPVTIDLHDVSRYVCAASLRACRHYYKVNLSAKTFEVAPPDIQSKLVPFGPYYPCLPTRDRSVWFRFASNVAVAINKTSKTTQTAPTIKSRLRDLVGHLRRLRRYRSRYVWSGYESPPLDAAERARDWKIVFNPACWDEIEGDEIRRMNEFRARLITTLRRELGPRFVGGFRRNETATTRYPEAVEPSPLSHQEYIRLLQSSPIDVYGNGKFGCFSWRLGEAFAASKCIVSEAMPNDAGEPLDERVGCLQSNSIDEMLTTLNNLLADDGAVAEYSHRAAAYYARRLQPQQRMRQLIAETVGLAPPSAITSRQLNIA